jgi:hypothetical protein
LNCELKAIDIRKMSDTKYEIRLEGKDNVGKSKLKGLLIFKGEGVAVILSKVYSNCKKAGQTGSFDILLYEGAGVPEQLAGKWSFHDHETSPRYSGTWYRIQV